MKYQAVLTQTVSCVVTFEAPDGATEEELEDAAYKADTPSLCHECSSSQNRSLNLDGDWDIALDPDGKPEITKESA